MILATFWNVVYGDAIDRPHFPRADLDPGKGLDTLRDRCAQSWIVWRGDVPSLPGAPLRRNDRVRLKRA
eukprot:gene1236-1251_t